MSENGVPQSVEELRGIALELLKRGEADAAVSELENALRVDYEDAETLRTLKCVHWWIEKLSSLDEIAGNYDKAYYIMGRWDAFYEFLAEIGRGDDRCGYAVRHFVYGRALEIFRAVDAEGPRHDPDLLLRKGRCFKGVGEYDNALECLKQVIQHMPRNGEALAEIADVYALSGDIPNAKGFFREAFFYNKGEIELNALESDIITDLAEKVRSAGIKGDAVAEWVPVYGALLRVFNVKRALKPAELGKLKQDVFILENDVNTKSEENQTTIPRLIKHYLRLLDHYEDSEEDTNQIREIHLRIKFIDPAIYDRYLGSA